MVPLTVCIMKNDLAVTFSGCCVAQYGPCTQKAEVRKKGKDVKKSMVGKKPPERACTRYGRVVKQRKNKKLYNIQVCTGNHHHVTENEYEQTSGRGGGLPCFEKKGTILTETHKNLSKLNKILRYSRF